ncbi:acyltransferase family protein [Paenibacillus camerounensis]|uniref:acyltransferase family protein n=1 Tax=Paenibacillus camerounensis TaxID=1243663 RepID=UPI0005A990B9|nr:acyltransferase [Paenibacillus camerounensis]
MKNNNAFSRNNNNFDLIRLVAALLVIWAHAYAVAPQVGKVEIVTRLTGITHSGEIAVFVFFFFSGALIFKSMEQSDTILSFMAKRFFRIYPALVACVLFTVLIGMFFTDLSVRNYFIDPQVYKYIKGNLGLIWNEHFLPGVYNDHPTSAINGSLWSITLEARLYIVVGIIGMFGLLRERLSSNVIIMTLLISVMVFPTLIPLIGSNRELLGLDVFPQYTVTFLLGGFVYYNSDKFRIGISVVILLGIFLFLAKDTILFKSIIMIFSIAAAYFLGTTSLSLKLRLPADISYGIYLYGWPSLQLTYQAFPKAGTELNAILSCILAAIFATASWFLVEKPSINLARKLTIRLKQRIDSNEPENPSTKHSVIES